MAKDFILIKTPHGFAYATDADKEKASSWKMGKPLKCEIKEQSSRSLQHHRLFFGGLLELVFQYWEPDTGLTTESECKLLRDFAKKLDDFTDGDLVSEFAEEYLSKLGQHRAQKIQVPHKTKEGLLNWIKDKTDHVEIIVTPTGIKRVPKSINFNSMSKSEFEVFYKKAFSVCWRYLLSQNFKDEAEAQRVIDSLSMMG